MKLDILEIEVARDKKIWGQNYARGNPITPLKNIGKHQIGEELRFVSIPIPKSLIAKLNLIRLFCIKWFVQKPICSKAWKLDGNVTAV